MIAPRPTSAVGHLVARLGAFAAAVSIPVNSPLNVTVAVNVWTRWFSNKPNR